MFAKLKLCLALLAAALLIGCGGGHRDFIDANGKGLTWESHQGQWLVINYWAEWCAPCREEIPELNALHADDNNIRVWGVNFDNPAIDDLKRQMKVFDIEFPVIQNDPEQQLAHLVPEALPTTYVFDPQGKLLHTLLGPQTQATIEAVVHGS